MILQDNQIKISTSANGKARVIEITSINIRLDIQVISIGTLRRFFEIDDTQSNGLGIELTGKVDFPLYEHSLVAANDNDHLCNPNNGVSCYLTSTDSDGTKHYTDALGNGVASPIGLFDFFRPYLSQPVAIMILVLQNVQAEDQIYHTWDK